MCLASFLALLASAPGCTPAPVAPDSADPGQDGAVAPGDDIQNPGDPDVPVAPGTDVVARHDAYAPDLQSTVTPGSGSGPLAATPRTAAGLSCTSLGNLSVAADLLTEWTQAYANGYWEVSTGMTYTVGSTEYDIYPLFGGVPSQFTGRNIDLGLPPQTDFYTSPVDLLVGTGCRGSGAAYTCDHWYFQNSGVVVYDEIGTAPGQRFTGRFFDVLLTEVRVDFDAGTATPVPGGGCIGITGLGFSTAPIPAPTAVDASTGSTGTGFGSEQGARATAGPGSGDTNQVCSSTNRACGPDTPDCVWTSTSTSGVCTVGCRFTVSCPLGFACVAVGGQGRCFPACVGDPCADTHLACTPVLDAYGRSTPVCLPPDWFAPARCGDHFCNGGETCTSCPGDCGACTCGPCEGLSCIAGDSCASRSCDGVFGCYVTGAGLGCDPIGTVRCPPRMAYDACTSNTDCGVRAECITVGSVPAQRCHEVCTTDADCRVSASGFDTRPRHCSISNSAGRRWCAMSCSGPTDTCPYGATCRANTDGTYGYCD
jgi:hypothetical protein